MWVMDPSSNGFFENYVFKLSSYLLSGSYFRPVYLYPGGFLASFAYLPCAWWLSLAKFNPSMMVNTSRTPLQALLSRLLFSVCCLGLVHKFLKISYPDQPFNFVLKGYALSMVCPISLWKVQFLLISLRNLSPFWVQVAYRDLCPLQHRCGPVGP